MMFCVCCRVRDRKIGGFFAEAADTVPDVEAALARRALYQRRATFFSAPAVHPEQGEFIIRQACVLTPDPDIGDLPQADVHVRDGVIVNVDRDLDATALHQIDGRGRIALPGFVAGHRHVCTNALRRAGAEDRDLALSLSGADAADIYKILRLVLLEAVSAGTTTLHHCASDIGGKHADTAILAQIDSGLRGRFSYPLDQPMSSAAAEALDRIEHTWFAPRSDHLLDLGMTFAHVEETSAAKDNGLAAVTLDPARALNLDHCVGSLSPGKRADLILVETGRQAILPDRAAAFALRAKASDILLVAIDGRLRKQNGVLTEPNEGLIRREGEDAIARLRTTTDGAMRPAKAPDKQ
jgi:cytosine/adenosine deaminase-related metal-dependent hydrolase